MVRVGSKSLREKLALEKGIEERVCLYARRRGWKSLKVKFVEVGYPDRMFILPGRICFIEFKRPGCEPEPIQNHRLLELIGYDIPATWTDTYDDAIGFLEAQAKLVAPSVPGKSDSPDAVPECSWTIPGPGTR